jgi:1-deoxy-D-xylulose-5-phosphate synthase
MGTVCARYPFVIPFHSQTLTRRLDCSISQFPLSRITLYSSSSRILIHRVCARPDIDDFYWEKVPTPILDTVQNPLCLKNLSQQELKQLAAEIRLELSSILSGTQILLNPSMAVVDLTVAIHHVFHAPVDKILWDVGDQVRFSCFSFQILPFVVESYADY